ncbi:MAG: Hsp20/alpha crystallin family protein [bacterium]
MFAQDHSGTSDQPIVFREEDNVRVEAADEAIDAEAALELPLDLIRAGNQLIVRAPIVGAGIHDITITVSGNQLTIHKNSTTEEAEREEYPYVQECHWGALSRTISLPKPVDPNRTRASLHDGILTVVMPIVAKSHTQVIRIEE